MNFLEDPDDNPHQRGTPRDHYILGILFPAFLSLILFTVGAVIAWLSAFRGYEVAVYAGVAVLLTLLSCGVGYVTYRALRYIKYFK